MSAILLEQNKPLLNGAFMITNQYWVIILHNVYEVTSWDERNYVWGINDVDKTEFLVFSVLLSNCSNSCTNFITLDNRRVVSVL